MLSLLGAVAIQERRNEVKIANLLIAFTFSALALIVARFVSKVMQLPYDDMMFGCLTYGVIYDILTAKEGGSK